MSTDRTDRPLEPQAPAEHDMRRQPRYVPGQPLVDKFTAPELIAAGVVFALVVSIVIGLVLWSRS